MKVALMGSNGQLGSDLCKTAPSAIELLAWTRKDVDLTDPRSVEKILAESRPEILINTAAYVRTEDCEVYSEKAFHVNGYAVRDLCQACRKEGITLLHISTDFVFDGLQTRPYLEGDAPRPLNTYGISKYCGELYIQSLLEKYYIIRSASLYGKAGASGKGGNFVYTILNKARKQEPLRVIQDIVMSPTYTFDLARGIWDLLLEKKPYGIYHIANSGSASWFQFASKILEVAKIPTQITPILHHELPSKMKKALYLPLASEKGTALRPWEEALEAFLASLE